MNCWLREQVSCSSSNGKWIDILGSLHLSREEGGQEEITQGVRYPGCQEPCAILNGNTRWGWNIGFIYCQDNNDAWWGGVPLSPFGLDLTLTRPRDSTSAIALPKKMGVVLAFCALPLGWVWVLLLWLYHDSLCLLRNLVWCQRPRSSQLLISVRLGVSCDGIKKGWRGYYLMMFIPIVWYYIWLYYWQRPIWGHLFVLYIVIRYPSVSQYY